MTYRGYRIEGLGTYSLVKIMNLSSGQVPDALTGTFTNTHFARKAVDGFLEGLKKKVTKNGTSETPSTV